MRMPSSILASGRGGLGVVELGRLLGWYYVIKGYNVSVIATYGPQTRGGYVNSSLSSMAGGLPNPYQSEYDVIFVIDVPGLEQVGRVKSGGAIFINSSLVSAERLRDDVEEHRMPFTAIAEYMAKGKLREPRVATNAAAFGAFLKWLGAGEEELAEPIARSMEGRSKEVVELNLSIAREGYRRFGAP